MPMVAGGPYTYTGDPNGNELDAVRVEIGDTWVDDKGKQLLSDNEIYYALDKEGTVIKAAARCCEMIAAFLYRDPDFRIGNYRESRGQLGARYERKAEILRKRGVTKANLIAGGISKDDKEAVEDDEDRTVPFFSREMHKNTESMLDETTTKRAPDV